MALCSPTCAPSHFAVAFLCVRKESSCCVRHRSSQFLLPLRRFSIPFTILFVTDTAKFPCSAPRHGWTNSTRFDGCTDGDIRVVKPANTARDRAVDCCWNHCTIRDWTFVCNYPPRRRCPLSFSKRIPFDGPSGWCCKRYYCYGSHRRGRYTTMVLP